MQLKELLILTFFTLTGFVSGQISNELIIQKQNHHLVSATKTLEEQIQHFHGLIHDENNIFMSKKMNLIVNRVDTDVFEFWNKRREKITNYFYESIHTIIDATYRAYSTIEGKPLASSFDYQTDKYRKDFPSIYKSVNLEDREVFSSIFVGPNPMSPSPEVDIISINYQMRRNILSLLGSYSKENESYVFNCPENIKDLSNSLKSANSIDTFYLANIYKMFYISNPIYKVEGEFKEVPWVSDNFYTSSVLEAMLVLKQMHLKLLEGYHYTLKFINGKIDAPTYYIDKVEHIALPVEKSSVTGEALYKVVFVGYRENQPQQIRYTFDLNQPKDEWVSSKGYITIPENKIGKITIYGETKTKIKGEMQWFPWTISYVIK